MSRRLPLLSSIAGLLMSGAVAADTLTVYTYDSFTSDWGPGPKVKAAFEAECGCSLNLVGLEDGVSLLNRLKIESTNSDADVILGIDTNLTHEARETGLFEAHGISVPELALPVTWSDAEFLPYDFGYFAFVHNTEVLSNAPASLKALVEDSNGPNILIQDPRTSTPGLGLLLWMKKVFGDQADAAWKKLQPRIVTVTKGWSEAYGMFLKNEAPMVLSYTTSPAYHAIAEEDSRFAAAEFEDGHYLQIEVAGLLAHSPNKVLARQFLDFMMSNRFQDLIPTTNWMYPSINGAELPSGFADLVKPETVHIYSDVEVADKRREWIDEWLDAMSE